VPNIESLARPQVCHVHIGPQTSVVRQVPSIVVRIRIDHDVIAIPQPVAARVVVVWRSLKKESAHVEALAIASAQPPNVLWPNRSSETSMLPGMIQMVVRIVPPCVVSHPAIVLRVNVRRLRMTFLILISPSLLALLLRLPLRLFRGRSPRRRRSVLGNVPAANSLLVSSALLRLAAVLLSFLLLLLISLLPGPFLCQYSSRKTHSADYQQHAYESDESLHLPSSRPWSYYSVLDGCLGDLRLAALLGYPTRSFRSANLTLPG